MAYTLDAQSGPGEAPADVLVQRRPGLVVGVAAPGRARPEAREDATTTAACRRRPTSSSTTSTRWLDVDRPRVHRPGRHRLQPRGQAASWAKKFWGLQGRHRVGRRVHPALPDALRALGVAARSWSARATARRARPGSSGYLRGPRHRASTASCWSRRSSTSRPLDFARGNDLPYALYLPTYTATAWYHKKLPPDLQAKPLAARCSTRSRRSRPASTRRAARRATALHGGGARGGRWTQLARYTGLSTRRSSSAPTCASRSSASARSCCATERRTVGRLDSRFKGIDATRAGETSGLRPEHGRDPAALHGDVQRLRARASWATRATSTTTSSAAASARRGTSADRRQRLPRRQRVAARAFAKNPHMKLFVASRLLRPGDAVLRDRVHARATSGSTPASATRVTIGVLRGRAHDVHPRGRAGAAQAGRDRLPRLGPAAAALAACGERATAPIAGVHFIVLLGGIAPSPSS